MFRAVLSVFCVVLFCTATGARQAHAAASEWVEKKPARYRLVAAVVDGQPYAALQIDMKPGWHTYWRYPGASGIAPEFDFAESRGVSSLGTHYPAPHFFDDGIGGFYGYEGMAGFVFPLKLSTGARLNVSGLIGVCREVCVPMPLDLVLPLNEIDAQDNTAQQAFIADLLAERAQPPSDALRLERVSFDGVSLQLVVTGQDLEAPQAMYIPGPHDVLGEPRIAASHPAAFLIEIPAWSKLDHPLIGRKLTFVVRDGARVVEQQMLIEDHGQMPRRKKTDAKKGDAK